MEEQIPVYVPKQNQPPVRLMEFVELFTIIVIVEQVIQQPMQILQQNTGEDVMDITVEVTQPCVPKKK
jgi:hypothetical protein